MSAAKPRQASREFVALFAFDGASLRTGGMRGLSLAVGTTVRDVGEVFQDGVSSGWLKGSAAGQTGVFPASYVEEAVGGGRSEPVAEWNKRRPLPPRQSMKPALRTRRESSTLLTSGTSGTRPGRQYSQVTKHAANLGWPGRQVTNHSHTPPLLESQPTRFDSTQEGFESQPTRWDSNNQDHHDLLGDGVGDVFDDFDVDMYGDMDVDEVDVWGGDVDTVPMRHAQYQRASAQPVSTPRSTTSKAARYGGVPMAHMGLFANGHMPKLKKVVQRRKVDPSSNYHFAMASPSKPRGRQSSDA